MKGKIIDLSTKHSIVTQFTSFVAIEKREEGEIFDERTAPTMDELLSQENVDFLEYMAFDHDLEKFDVKILVSGKLEEIGQREPSALEQSTTERSEDETSEDETSEDESSEDESSEEESSEVEAEERVSCRASVDSESDDDMGYVFYMPFSRFARRCAFKRMNRYSSSRLALFFI